MTLKGNKGEWSEIFVFLSLLKDGKINSADENLNKIVDIYYVVLRIFRENKSYLCENDTIKILDGNVETVIPVGRVIDSVPILLDKIKSGTSAFPVSEIESLLEDLKISTLKAKSNSKGDLQIKIHDYKTGIQPEIGFSIKSFIGSNPTLLNASGATVMNFRLSHSVAKSLVDEVNGINTRSKIIDRLRWLRDGEIGLIFESLESLIFYKNLQMIDFKMPQIMSELFLCSYLVKGKKVKDVVDYYCIEYEMDSTLIEFKVKELLVATALGMVPATPWQGLDEAKGGYIIAKDNGEVLCYHIYDRNRLKDYLYNYTAFESPSSNRTGAGLIHEENGKQIFKLTLQIRFFG